MIIIMGRRLARHQAAGRILPQPAAPPKPVIYQALKPQHVFADGEKLTGVATGSTSTATTLRPTSAAGPRARHFGCAIASVKDRGK
jgi:hypothetical protein